MLPSADSTLAGRYRLVEPLGAGGMGRVWKAEDLRLRRSVAIKILSAAHVESQLARSRFEREAMSAARLKSANIVRVHDFGIEDGTPYIVMELVEGTDLHQRLKRVRTLDVHETAEILHQTARGLRIAHKAGVIHRDLKPANLMIDQSEGEEIIKVMDFGVAKATLVEPQSEPSSGPPTAPDMVLGTPQFMSPEHVRDTSDVDARSDVWSLGVIAYRCLAGKLPFHGSTVASVLVSVCVDEPTPVSQLRPDITPHIDIFFQRALAKDPRDRYQSVTELAQAFYQICELSTPADTGRPSRSEIPSWSGEHSFPTPTSLTAHERPGSSSIPSIGSLNGAIAAPQRPSSSRRWPIALLSLLAFGALAAVAFFALRAPTSLDTEAAPASTSPRASASVSPPSNDGPIARDEPTAEPEASATTSASASATATPSASASASARTPAPPPRLRVRRPKPDADADTEIYGDRN